MHKCQKKKQRVETEFLETQCLGPRGYSMKKNQAFGQYNHLNSVHVKASNCTVQEKWSMKKQTKKENLRTLHEVTGTVLSSVLTLRSDFCNPL